LARYITFVVKIVLVKVNGVSAMITEKLCDLENKKINKKMGATLFFFEN
tara:strand:- start:340 stop:486 length:147 start_codon:yes stop_codon:yes gene_type:complete